jgi:glycosyltransferase involved in cell wall biosynthesis
MPDGQPWPKISIVTPSYNQGQFLEKTIRSVLLQAYPNLEYVVIDGGSTDQSIELIKRYAPWISGWVSEPDRGQAHAINKGFSQVTGEILAWLNSDDYYMPGALKKVALAFSKRKREVGALTGHGRKVNRSGDTVYTPPVVDLNFDSILDWTNSNFMQPSCFFRAEAWEQCGPLREDLKYCIDVDLWLKIAQHFQFDRIDVLLSSAIKHENAKTTAERERAKVEVAFLALDYGRRNVAFRTLNDMADNLAEARRKLRMVKMHPLYTLVGPIYRWYRKRTT